MLSRAERLEDVFICGSFHPEKIKCVPEALDEAKRLDGISLINSSFFTIKFYYNTLDLSMFMGQNIHNSSQRTIYKFISSADVDNNHYSSTNFDSQYLT